MINDFIDQSPQDIAEWLYDRFRHHTGTRECPFYDLSDKAQRALIKLAMDLKLRDLQFLQEIYSEIKSLKINQPDD